MTISKGRSPNIADQSAYARAGWPVHQDAEAGALRMYLACLASSGKRTSFPFWSSWQPHPVHQNDRHEKSAWRL